MIVFRENDDYEPLTWVRGVPVYVTTMLVALHSVALMVVLLAGGMGSASWVNTLPYNSVSFLEHGTLWQCVTYAFVNRAVHPLFFLVEMIFFYLFGREVERYLGRRRYTLLYGALVVSPPVVLTAFSVLMRAFGGNPSPMVLEGAGCVHLAVFIAFARLYPGVQFFLRIRAAWMAGALFGLFLLFAFANRAWSNVWALISDTGVALLGIAWIQGVVPSWLTWQRWRLRWWRRKRAEEAAEVRVSGTDPMEAIDPLLDKIARHGLESLTEAERQTLEKARQALMDRSKR